MRSENYLMKKKSAYNIIIINGNHCATSEMIAMVMMDADYRIFMPKMEKNLAKTAVT